MASTLRFDGQVVLVTGAGGGEHAKAGGHAPPGDRGVGAAAGGSQDAGCGRRCGVGEEAAWGVRSWTRCDRVEGRGTAVVGTPSLLWRGKWGRRLCVGSHEQLPTRSGAALVPVPPCAAARGPECGAGGGGAGLPAAGRGESPDCAPLSAFRF